jgi:phage-related protein/DNA-binding XRE family transcriptional regulator
MKIREVVAYGNYFQDFLESLPVKVQNKIFKIIEAVEILQRVPQQYLKSISGSKRLFEVRIQLGSDIWRVFCFFENERLVILLNGFVKKTQKTPKEEIKLAMDLMKRNMMTNQEDKIISWNQIKDNVYGQEGTQRRDDLDRDFESFKIGLLLRKAREEKKLTQEQLAQLVEKKRTFISRLENDGSNMTLKTLYDIVEKGLGGKIQISIQFD